MKRIVGDVDLPAGYEQLSAEGKAEWLWDVLVVQTNHESTDFPPLRMPFTKQPAAELAVVMKRTELEKALTRTADVMEPGRPKVIHAVGSVARVELKTTAASPFTGLLGPPAEGGGAIGVLRMSLVASVSRKRPYTPGFGLKFLIDGRPSADVLGMNHTVGQGRDFNLFSNSMTNDLTDEHKELGPPQKIMSRLFDRVSHEPRRLITSHLTNQRRDGSSVDQPITPLRLVFHPTTEARDLLAKKPTVDFRMALADVPPGTALYNVVGLVSNSSTPDGSEQINEVPIGVLRTTTPFVSSDGGDRLYFRHVQAPEDRRL